VIEITERVFRYVCVGMCGMATTARDLTASFPVCRLDGLSLRAPGSAVVNQLPITISTTMVAIGKAASRGKMTRDQHLCCTCSFGQRLEGGGKKALNHCGCLA
jgi:hypothetical protein